jgi:hypothetical protein
MNTALSRTLGALALQALALAVLAAAWLGHTGLDPRRQPRVLVLVDRSDSMPAAAVDAAVREVLQASRAAGAGRVDTLDFAARVLQVAPSAADRSATDIEAALGHAMATHARTPLAAVVVVSDGLETTGDTRRGLQALRDAGVPLSWWALGRPAPPSRIGPVLAPAQARVGQPVALTVQLQGALAPPLRLTASFRSADGRTERVSAAPDAAGLVRLAWVPQASGALVVELALDDAASGRSLHRVADAVAVDVAPPAALLVAEGGRGVFAASLAQGGWRVNRVPARRLDAEADRLDGLQAVVLDDVAIADASPRFWDALAGAVRDRGLGLLVLGGERSFARGGYRGSTLEALLPLLSEPAALDQPAAVLFAVDKSGSMGQGSGGVDRFQQAQRAVLDTANGLGERDTLGLLVFDVVPRVLVPLGPVAAGRAALARDWAARPNGGTRLAPALEAAIAELDRTPVARRLLVLVTDGFVDAAPLARLRERLAAARIDALVLAVGPEADTAALQQLFGGGAGQVVRVEEAAELPAVMRPGLERRRAPVERGPLGVQQVQDLPSAPGRLAPWPPIDAYPVTRTRPGAQLLVQSERGDPLIALHMAGRGRVLAVPGGLGPWAPQWLAWREWPRLAGGLVDAVGGGASAAAPPWNVIDEPGQIQVQLEAAGAAEAWVLRADTPAAPGRVLTLQALAPGRWQATLPEAGPGLYTFTLATPAGVQRQLHLRQARAEQARWGTQAALKDWQQAGLLRPWDGGAPVPQRQASQAAQPPDRTLIGLAGLLFLGGVLVDRARWADGLVWLRRWARWRRAAQ